MDFIESFPLEVIEMVFSHLTDGGLVEATLISPRANRIISNSAQLMQNIRLKIEKEQPGRGTRKYQQFDFLGVIDPPIIADLPVNLTQLTIDACEMKATVVHAMLTRISATLELFVVDCITFTAEIENPTLLEFFEPPRSNLEPLNFPKLRTLIAVDLDEKCEFSVFASIRATNLIELGLVKNADCCIQFPKENFDAVVLIELIKLNPKLKILHLPRLASEVFLSKFSENLEFELQLEELSLSFTTALTLTGSNYCEKALSFLETQRSTIKCLKLEGCKIEEEHSLRFLSFNLMRLEILDSSMEFSQNAVIENVTIGSLAFIGIKIQGNSNPEAINNFIKCCKNLAAFDAIFIPQQDIRYPDSWKCIDTRKNLPKHIWWADCRSLRFAGVGFCIEYILDHQGYNVYQGRLKEVTVEQHPYEIIEFREMHRPSFSPDFDVQ